MPSLETPITYSLLTLKSQCWLFTNTPDAIQVATPTESSTEVTAGTVSLSWLKLPIITGQAPYQDVACFSSSAKIKLLDIYHCCITILVLGWRRSITLKIAVQMRNELGYVNKGQLGQKHIQYQELAIFSAKRNNLLQYKANHSLSYEMLLR